MSARKERIRQLNVELSELDTRRNALLEERKALHLEQSKEEHPCACVRLNRDVEVYDMQEQERRGRVPLSVGGFVMDSLSALKNCRECNGTGKPVPAPLYHTCETFNPDTCSACRVIQRNID